MFIILFSFSILSKFASNSYAFPIVITQIHKITRILHMIPTELPSFI